MHYSHEDIKYMATDFINAHKAKDHRVNTVISKIFILTGLQPQEIFNRIYNLSGYQNAN